MQLRCKYCAAVQPVTVADEADEDLRTQGIRRAFRAEHLASCGEAAVALELDGVETTHVDPEAWNRYLAAVHPPADVILGADGLFSRSIVRDGVRHLVRVCEDCWQNIPRYVDYAAGLTSPESDGDAGATPKFRPDTVETDSPKRAAAVRHVLRAVCVPCYRAAFRRVYPDAPLPLLNEDVIGDGAPVELPPPVPAEALGRVTLARWDQKDGEAAS